MDGKSDASVSGGGLAAPLAVDEDLADPDMDTSMADAAAAAVDQLSEGEAGTVEKAVRDLLGPEQQVVSVHKKREVVQESEVIMVNGNPITLTGKHSSTDSILKQLLKKCLMTQK